MSSHRTKSEASPATRPEATPPPGRPRPRRRRGGVGANGLKAAFDAQALIWAPILFQAACVLRDRGVLRELVAGASAGRTVAELEASTNTSGYGLTVLLEAGMSAGLVQRDGERYRPTRVAALLERDPMTRANMNFVRDVCYRPMTHLAEAIESGEPAGLRELGDQTTIYEALSSLGEPERTSWFEFDHFYSDRAFELVLPAVLRDQPRRLLDIGANTGKFALACLKRDPSVTITVADLPGQLAVCERAVAQAGFSDRVRFFPVDFLAGMDRGEARSEPSRADPMDGEVPLPNDADVVWMSQFLCCFSEREMLRILTSVRRALRPDARVFILDTFCDRQTLDVAALCLRASSLYFTCLANGNSRMYDSGTVLECVERAGLHLVAETDGIGWGHTLLECRPMKSL